MIAILAGVLKFLGVCFIVFIVFALWACVHVGKMRDKQEKWWEDDEQMDKTEY